MKEWLVACLAASLLLAGCGNSSSPASTPAPSSPTPPSSASTPVSSVPAFQISWSQSFLVVGDTSRAQAFLTSSSTDVTAQSSWTSSNPATATVGGNGLITALHSGTTTIQAQFQGMSATALLIVYDGSDIFSITVGINSQLTVGDSSRAELGVTLKGGGGLSEFFSSATFTSSNPSVLAISPDGVWTALSAGTADVVGTYLGQSGTQHVTVVAIQDSLAFSAQGASGSIQRGGVVTISSVMLYTLVSVPSAQIIVQQFDQSSRLVDSASQIVTSGNQKAVTIQETFTIPSGATALCPVATMQLPNGKSVAASSPNCLFISQ